MIAKGKTGAIVVTTRASHVGLRRVEQGPGGFMCWQYMPPMFPEHGDTMRYWGQGGFTTDSNAAEAWLNGYSPLLQTVYMTTGQADYRLPHEIVPC